MSICFFELHELPPETFIKYAVIVAVHEGRLVWCRHHLRDTWEVPGGHVEPGETAVEAARRELREETAALDFRLTPVCFYSVRREDGSLGSKGLLSIAEVFSFDGALESEIAEVRCFDRQPEGLTYPAIQPVLLRELKRRGLLQI